jgi:hypothetical protein
MPGALDKVFKEAAKAIVADLGDGLNTKIDYIRKFSGEYDIDTGAFSTFDRPYSDIKVPIEFVNSDEEAGYQENVARLYISPDLIGNNQPTLQDEIVLKYQGANRATKIQDIQTYRGGQEYLYIVRVVF